MFPASVYYAVRHIGRHLRYKRAESSDECRSSRPAENRLCRHYVVAYCSTVFREEIPGGCYRAEHIKVFFRQIIRKRQMGRKDLKM